MKITKYMGAFAVIAMLAACSTDDEQGTNTAANEVKITTNVGGNSIFTRSNPLGTKGEQENFNEGDAISVTTTSVRDNKLCLKALSCIYIRDIVAWQPSIYHGWLLRQNPHVKYAMLEKTQLFRIFDNVSSKCLGLVVKETVCP